MTEILSKAKTRAEAEGDVPLAVRMEHIYKSFGKVCANKDVCLELRQGEILALLGENGSGKTSLVNMLSGVYFPDAGDIYIRGNKETIRSPRDAYNLGIGMIHQHFKLVEVFTAAENIVLGQPGTLRMSKKNIEEEVTELAERYGFEIDPTKKIYDMSVSEKQTTEIIKILYRGADILILDEPTAVLTPHETKKLFSVMRNMKAHGKSLIIITHKLGEVMAVSDRVEVLRKGAYISTVDTSKTGQAQLTEMMVGKPVNLRIERPELSRGDEKLQVVELSCLNSDGVKVLDKVSFTVYGGEILGIAGIAGSGQKELCEAIAGLYPTIGGAVLMGGEYEGEPVMESILGLKPDVVSKKGISMAFVPEDRLGMGLVASLDITDNLMLRSYKDRKGPFVDRKRPRALAEQLIEDLAIVAAGPSAIVGRLSGGNVQKVLIGREIAQDPSVLLVAYPVRGLDINSSYKIYDLLNEQKKKGVAIVFIGEDLDVLLELSDRLLVLSGGRVSDSVDPRSTSKEELGMLMVQDLAALDTSRSEPPPEQLRLDLNTNSFEPKEALKNKNLEESFGHKEHQDKEPKR